MPKCDFKLNIIEITLWYGCFPVNLLHIFRTPFLKNASGGLLLHLVDSFCNILLEPKAYLVPCQTSVMRLIGLDYFYKHTNTAKKMKFFIKDFFSKCDQIHIFLRI